MEKSTFKQSSEEDEIILNDFQLIGEKRFVQYASHSHMHQVDKFEARLLNTKFGVDIYWCSIKRDGAEFDAYLAEFGFPHEEKYKIGSKLHKARLEIFQELDPNHGTGK